MLITKASFEYAFYWAGQPVPPSRLAGNHETAQVGFGSSQQAIQFLRVFPQLNEFRALLAAQFPGQTHQWRIEDVSAKMADLMVRKRLLVMKRWVRAEGPNGGASAATVVPRKAEVQPEQQTEGPTFPSNHDDDAQAETLQNAAATSEPFCEECEKARQAARTFPPQEPVEDPLPDVDPADQVQALTSAASAGAAFCEECAKALAALAAVQPPAPEEPEEKSPVDADEDMQATALAAAAESGVPFCEECEKLAALNAALQNEEPAVGGFPPDHDDAAQASTLQMAAESGAPFCEECEKAKAAQAASAATA